MISVLVWGCWTANSVAIPLVNRRNDILRQYVTQSHYSNNHITQNQLLAYLKVIECFTFSPARINEVISNNPLIITPLFSLFIHHFSCSPADVIQIKHTVYHEYHVRGGNQEIVEREGQDICNLTRVKYRCQREQTSQHYNTNTNTNICY